MLATGQICTKGHFCTKRHLHEVSLLNEDTSARRVTFARDYKKKEIYNLYTQIKILIKKNYRQKG